MGHADLSVKQYFQRGALEPAGVIDATSTSKTNAQATADFPLEKGQRLAVQCDTASFHVRSVTADDDTVTANTGVLVAQGALYDLPLRSTDEYLAVITASSADVKVFRYVK